MKAAGILLAIVGIIGAAFWMVRGIMSPRRPVDIAAFARSAQFMCEGGKSFSIAFGEKDETVTIAFKDGRTFALNRTESSSGSRYANAADEVVLWLKGKEAYAEEVGKRTHTKCVLQDDAESRKASHSADPQRAVAW